MEFINHERYLHKENKYGENAEFMYYNGKLSRLTTDQNAEPKNFQLLENQKEEDWKVKPSSLVQVELISIRKDIYDKHKETIHEEVEKLIKRLTE